MKEDARRAVTRAAHQRRDSRDRKLRRDVSHWVSK